MDQPPSIARAIGQFVGHIRAAVKTDVGPVTVAHLVEEQTVLTREGPVTLRRTTIDQVVPAERAPSESPDHGTP